MPYYQYLAVELSLVNQGLIVFLDIRTYETDNYSLSDELAATIVGVSLAVFVDVYLWPQLVYIFRKFLRN